jgi:hypothetical protein
VSGLCVGQKGVVDPFGVGIMTPIEAIRQRHQRLTTERANLTVRIAAIDKELNELVTSERVIIGLADSEESGLSSPIPFALYSARIISKLKRRAAGRQICEMVLEVLRDAYPEELKAAEIRQLILARFEVEINPNTLTVSLVRHREARLVKLVKKAWSYIPSSDGGDSRKAVASDESSMRSLKQLEQ